jgi:hypothetical protein
MSRAKRSVFKPDRMQLAIVTPHCSSMQGVPRPLQASESDPICDPHSHRHANGIV